MAHLIHLICLSIYQLCWNWNRPQMYESASNVQIGLKCTESTSNLQISLKCTAVYLSIYLSALLKLASNVQIGLKCTDRPQMYVHLRLICTFETDRTLLGKGVWSSGHCRTSPSQSCTPSPDRVQSASNVHTFEANYVHLRPIPYIWGWISLKCTAVWLAQTDCLKCTAVWLAQTDHMTK